MPAPFFMVDRYAIHDPIASGGMASVHLARRVGKAGFCRVFAAKRLHPHLAVDPDLSLSLADEARMMGRIRHANVVSVVDVVSLESELIIVMDYVPGASLAAAIGEEKARGTRTPPAIAVALVVDLLRGLQAAHEAVDEHGHPLRIIHRDVSPQNVLVGADGVARVLDFGVARAAGRLQESRTGWKGKPSYMAPEQLRGEALGSSTDTWAASVVLWETLTGHRLFAGSNDYEVSLRVMEKIIDRPGRIVPDIPSPLDDVVIRGLQRDSSERFSSALEMVLALEEALIPATTDQVREWLEGLVRDQLDDRARLVSALEREASEMECTEAPFARTTKHRTKWGSGKTLGTVVVVGAVGLGAFVMLTPGSSRPVAAPEIHGKPDALDAVMSASSVVSSSLMPVEVVEPSILEEDTPPRRVFRAPAAIVTQRESSASSPEAISSGFPKPAPVDSHRPIHCDPPYVIDDKGFQRLKPECL